MTGIAVVSPEIAKKADRDLDDNDSPHTDYEDDEDESLNGTNINIPLNNETNNDKRQQQHGSRSRNSSPPKKRFLPQLRKSNRNKDKAACEYYNEEAHLDDGDLPSLQRPEPPTSHNTLTTHGHGQTSCFRRAISPVSPPRLNSRAITPVWNNTEEGKKKLEKKKSKKKNNSNSNSNSSSSNKEAEIITIATPKLSTEDKRKHRAFWNQFDDKPDTESDEGGSQTDGSDYAPRDERKKQLSNATATPRQKETLVDSEEEEEDKGIYDMVMDMCSDCGWLTGEGGEEKKQQPQQSKSRRNSSSRRGRDSHRNRDVGSLLSDNEEEEEEQSSRRRSTMRGRQEEDESSVRTKELHYIDDEDDNDHHDDEDDNDVDVDDNSTIETKHTPSRKSKSKDDHSIKNEPLEVSSSKSSRRRGKEGQKEQHNYENTRIEVEYDQEEGEEKEDPRFLQLNPSGDIDVYSRPNGKNPQAHAQATSETPSSSATTTTYESMQSAPSMNSEPMPSDERGGYTLTSSKSWSGPQKNKYLQAMAQKAKDDFHKTKVSPVPKDKKRGIPLSAGVSPSKLQYTNHDNGGNDDDDDESITDIINKKVTKTPRKTIDWMTHSWTPSEKRRLFHLVKSEGMTPEEATELVISSRIKKTIEEQEKKTDVDNEVQEVEEVAAETQTQNVQQQPVVSTSRSEMFISGESSAFQPLASQASASSPRHSLEFTEYHGDNANVPPSQNMRRVQSDVTGRSADGESSILSNLRKKPGFNRVVEGNMQEEHVAQSVNRSLPEVQVDYERQSSKSVKSTKDGSFTTPSRKKRGKSGSKWQSINDNDDEYDSDENKAISTQRISVKKELPKDEIFEFESNTNNKEEERGPFGSVKLDPYYDSCDVSILGSMMGNETVMSSSRSVYTTATNSSTWSTSTRRRHRGAAKNRTPSNKEKRPVGWLETIKAAAESNNREWDPEVGWVGYVEPKEKSQEPDVKPDLTRIGKLKPPKIARSNKDSPSEDQEIICTESSDDPVTRNIPLPFPSEWEKERDEMVSVCRDDECSEVTEVIKNGMNDYCNQSVGVVSNAETEVVSNKIKNEGGYVYASIPETIGEDSSDEDDSSSVEETVQDEREKVVKEDRNDSDSDTKEEISYQKLVPDALSSLQTKARESIQTMMSTPSLLLQVDHQEQAPNPINEDENEDDEGIEVISSRSSHNFGVEKSSRGSEAQTTTKKQDHFADEAGSDTAESTYLDEDGEETYNRMSSFDSSDNGKAETSYEEEGEEFDNGMSSFDFLDNGKAEMSDGEDGFKVIDTTNTVSDQDQILYDDDKSVKSTSSLMSSRAKEWRKKVEVHKRSMSNQRAKSAQRANQLFEELVQEEPTQKEPAQGDPTQIEPAQQDFGNIFVSAVDDNSTIEYIERPKVLNIDEDDTLFDFGNERSVISPVEEKIEKSVKNRDFQERKQSSRGRKSRLARVNSEDLSEITTPTVGMNKPDSTFFDRLQSCSAEAVGNCNSSERKGSGLPRAHLQFLRNATTDVGCASNSQDNRAGGLISMLTSPGLCGRPETVDDDDEIARSKTGSKGNFASNYLDAINAGGKEFKKSPSVVSSSSAQSETWKRFLDKRETALSSRRSHVSDVSKAAQEYASQKVNEIVNRVNSDDKSKRNSTVYPMTRPPSSSGRQKNGSKSYSSRRRSPLTKEEMMTKSDAAKAAEDLAAARVEAMMAMEPRTLSHDEVEI